MTRNGMNLGATLLTGLALALPTTASAQSVASRPLQLAPNPIANGSYDRPAYAIDQFRGNRLDKIRTLIARGDYEKARLALDGRRSEIRTSEREYLLGVVSANLGNYRAASDAFRSSLSLDRRHIGASLGMALTDLRLGRRDRAEAIARTIDARSAACGAGCGEAAALDRASKVLRHVLSQS